MVISCLTPCVQAKVIVIPYRNRQGFPEGQWVRVTLSTSNLVALLGNLGHGGDIDNAPFRLPFFNGYNYFFIFSFYYNLYLYYFIIFSLHSTQRTSKPAPMSTWTFPHIMIHPCPCHHYQRLQKPIL